jgi:hemolysin activation/secretion protein
MGLGVRFTKVILLLFAFTAEAYAWAQDAGSLLRDRELANDLRLPELLPQDDAPSPDKEELPSAETEQVFVVVEVKFGDDAGLLSPEQRNQLSASIVGKTVGFAQVLSLADNANIMLRQNGFLLARAVIPPQDVTAGKLKIDVSEGFLEAVEFERGDSVRANGRLISRIIDQNILRDRLLETDLESAMLGVNDLPGVTARSRLSPGEVIGSSRLIVEINQEKRFSGALYTDNFGSPSTGRAQVHAQLGAADLTGFGDLSRLGFSYSEGQRYVSASTSWPLAQSGLSVSADYGYLDYENTDAIGRSAGLEGEAQFASIALDYQMVRSRDFNLKISAAFDGKTLVDDSAAGRLADKQIVLGSLSVAGDVRDAMLGDAVNQFSASWFAGSLDLSGLPSAEFADKLSLNTQGSFQRINIELVRYQSLGNNFNLLARGAGQWADKNLDSSEGYSLGGPYGVRGWPVGEARGDKGISGAVELQHDTLLAKELGRLRVSAFVDAGQIWLNEEPGSVPSLNVCACNDYVLASTGAAASWQYRNVNLTTGVAFGLGGNPGRSTIGKKNADGDNDRHQVWLSASIGF